MRRKLVAIGLVVLLGSSTVIAGTYMPPGEPPEEEQTHPFTVREVSGEVGFNYVAGGEGVYNTNAGVFVNDFNRDGWPDLLATGKETPMLFENTGGEFRRVTSFPELQMTVSSVHFFDYDGDGWEDLLLLPKPGSTDGPNAGEERPVLLRNDRGTFVVAQRLNVTFDTHPQGATTADYNNDGHLDLYIYQNGPWSERLPVGMSLASNETAHGNITDDNGGANILLKGTGSGFVNVTEEAGITGRHWSLAASFVDFTGDGLPDIHVANDFNEDVLYINQGNGTFERRRMGDFTDRNQMASEVHDVNGDARPDIFMTNILPRTNEDNEESDDGMASLADYGSIDPGTRSVRWVGNNLLINQGNGQFVDKADEYGVQRATKLWGWAAAMVDLDNDGDADLIHANNQRIGGLQRGSGHVPPPVWEFDNGTFRHLDPLEIGFKRMNSRGLARLDFDLDGDVDIAIASNQGDYHLYRNQLRESGGRFRNPLDGLFGNDRDHRAVQVLVRGEKTYLAHGARVNVTVGDRTRYRFVNDKNDFLSQDSRVLHVGLGTHTTVDRIVITWPDGTIHTLTDVNADQRLVVHPDGTVETIRLGPRDWF